VGYFIEGLLEIRINDTWKWNLKNQLEFLYLPAMQHILRIPTNVRLTGLYLHGSCFRLFLNIRVTLAIFQSCLTIPSPTDLLNISVNGSAILRRNFDVIPSSSAALSPSTLLIYLLLCLSDHHDTAQFLMSYKYICTHLFVHLTTCSQWPVNVCLVLQDVNNNIATRRFITTDADNVTSWTKHHYKTQSMTTRYNNSAILASS